MAPRLHNRALVSYESKVFRYVFIVAPLLSRKMQVGNLLLLLYLLNNIFLLKVLVKVSIMVFYVYEYLIVWLMEFIMCLQCY